MSLLHPSPPLGLVWPQVYQILQLNQAVAAHWEGSLWLLADGSYTPGIGDTTSTVFPHQVTWPGIVNPIADGWGNASIGADSYAVSQGPALEWTFNAASGDKTIGGVFALDTAGNLLGGQLVLNGPVVMSVTGQVLPFTPQVALSTIYP
jgi:hypothetical protein